MNKDQTSTQPTLVSRFTALLATALIASPVIAADEAADEDEPFIEEIVVTAEKRRENILEVPLTVTAFSDKLIEELGITNNDDLEQLVPGLQMGNLGEIGQNGISIRGIWTQNFGETHADLAVANYVDGVYTLNTSGSAANNFDLERIEVARGPQGTLNGRNSIAGSISYFTKKPTDYWDVNTLLELTDQVTQRLSVAAGGPITDSLSFRVKLTSHSGDGAQKNAGLGGDWDEPDEKSVNGQLRFQNDTLNINVSYTDYEDTGAPRGVLFLVDHTRDNPANEDWYKYAEPVPALTDCPGLVFDNGLSGAIDSGNFKLCDDVKNEINTNRPGLKAITRESWSLTADWSITDSLTLRYTGGDNVYDSLVNRDGDGTNRVQSGELNENGTQIPQDCIDVLGLDNCQDVGFSDVENRSIYAAVEESHELQLFTNFDGPFNFVAGLYRYEQATDMVTQSFDFSLNPEWYSGDPDQLARDNPIFGRSSADCDEFLENVANVLRWPNAVIQQTFCGVILFEFGHYFNSFSKGEAITSAAFFHADYTLNDSWNFSGGLRYTEDEKENTALGFEGNLGLRFGAIPLSIAGDLVSANKDTPGFEPVGKWDEIIWNVTAEYTTEGDDMIYGRLSTGYRPGAPNQGCCQPEALRIVNEETLVNYELGFKGLVLDNRLQITSAVFYQAFDGYQITGVQELPLDFDFSPGATSPLVEFTANVDDTNIWGAEIEFTWVLDERWRLSGYYNYLDSELGVHRYSIPTTPLSIRETSTVPFPRIDSNSSSEFFGTQVCTEAWVAENGDYPGASCYWVRPNDVTGNQLPQQPNHKMALTLVHTMPTAFGQMSFLGTYSWTSERFADIGNFHTYDIPAYSRLDLRANWTSLSDTWRVTAYVQNVLDNVGLVEFFPASGIGDRYILRR